MCVYWFVCFSVLFLSVISGLLFPPDYFANVASKLGLLFTELGSTYACEIWIVTLSQLQVCHFNNPSTTFYLVLDIV